MALEATKRSIATRAIDFIFIRVCVTVVSQRLLAWRFIRSLFGIAFQARVVAADFFLTRVKKSFMRIYSKQKNVEC